MKKNNYTLILSICAIALSTIAISLNFFIMATHRPDDEQMYKDAIKSELHNFSAPLPLELTFCGEKVPLDNIFVREALDRELTSIMYQHGTTFQILKRSWRFFPEIEQYLKEFGGHDDLKYLAVAESALSDVVSPAKAAGFWQFMPKTAKEYGLTVSEEWDERYDLRKATEAAVKYLKSSYSRFGNWALTCAAYNCGENGVKRQMAKQDCKDYWGLAINNETSRYVYRILAYKVLMQDPRQYGFYVRQKDCHQPLQYDTITIDSTITNMPMFAKALNCPYKYFKILNPQVRSDKLTNPNKKTHTFKIISEENISYSKALEQNNLSGNTFYLE